MFLQFAFKKVEVEEEEVRVRVRVKCCYFLYQDISAL